MPQGGIIQYQYTGANNGIVCADGTPTGLIRTGGVSRTYTRSSIAATTSHTDVIDGLNNTSNYDFVMAGSPESFYETNRTVRQGATTVLLSRQTCYNNSGHPCTQIYGTSSGWKGSQFLNQADTVLNQQVSYSYGDGFNRLTARTVTRERHKTTLTVTIAMAIAYRRPPCRRAIISIRRSTRPTTRLRPAARCTMRQET